MSIKQSKKGKINCKQPNMWIFFIDFDVFFINFDLFQYIFNLIWSILKSLMDSESNLIDFVMTIQIPARNLDQKSQLKLIQLQSGSI